MSQLVPFGNTAQLSPQMQQLSFLSSLATQDKPLDLSKMVDALASRITASGAFETATAATTLKEAGLNVADHIPVSIEAIKAQRELMRLEFERQQLQEQMDNVRAHNELDIRNRTADTIIREAQAASLSTP